MSLLRVVLSRSPHSHAMRSPVSRHTAFHIRGRARGCGLSTPQPLARPKAFVFFLDNATSRQVQARRHRSPGFRGFGVFTAEGAYPRKNGRRGSVKHFCDHIHRKPVAIEKDGEGFLRNRPPSVGMVFRPLRVAVFALIALFFVDTSIFHEVRVLTSWAVHLSFSPCRRVWIYP